MASTRPRDRLDRRLAARRLRGRHVRAVALALARRPHGDAAEGRLTLRRVFVGRRRRVHIDATAPRAPRDAADLALELAELGAARRAEQLLAAYTLAADAYDVYRTPALRVTGAAPLLVAVGGGVASGKSTLAKAAARRGASPRIETDRVRDALLALLPDSATHEFAWTAAFRASVYARLFDHADAALTSGRSVVLDGCFAQAEQRRAAAALARRHGARFVFVHCDPPPAAIAERLRRRNRRDGGGWDALAATARFEPRAPDEPPHLRIDTEERPARSLEALARFARGLA